MPTAGLNGDYDVFNGPARKNNGTWHLTVSMNVMGKITVIPVRDRKGGR